MFGFIYFKSEVLNVRGLALSGMQLKSPDNIGYKEAYK